MTEPKKPPQRSETLSLTAVGDRELWVMDGPERSWSIPLYLDWKIDVNTKESFGMIYPAISPYATQAMAMNNRLAELSHIESKERWLIHIDDIYRMIRKADGITPRYYYKWPDPYAIPIPAADPMKIGKDNANQPGAVEWEDFLRHVAKKYSIPLVMLRVFWRAISSEAPRWMLESRQALDMGFCRLLALPYRPNWKEIVTHKMSKWKLGSIFNGPSHHRRQALEDLGVPAVLCSPDNIGIARSAKASAGGNFRLNYTLEAVPTKQFEKMVNIVEGERLACGSTSYVASFEKTIESQYHHILATLEAYLKKVSSPFADVLESGVSGVLRFVPTSGLKKKVRGHSLARIPVHIVAPDSPFSAIGEKSEQALVRPKAAPLPEMPAVPHGTDDLRRSSRQRALVGPGQTEANGVPVLDASQGGDATCDLLPERAAEARDTSGVAGGVDDQ